MKLLISPRAEKQLKKLGKVEQIVVTHRIRSLPQFKDKQKLKGYSNVYRIRIGNIRIVFKQTKQEVYIILIHHRKDVYRLFRQLLS